ncbi:Zinc finger protein [Ceratobasidium sp. AG-Ba]|nr:Zinc finger protein [Ceratobasidium sp. AG-Ba]
MFLLFLLDSEKLRHRHAGAHECVPVSGSPTVDKKAEARALLSKLFPDAKSSSAGTSRARPAPSDPAKRAKLRAIELMKMKHKAISADPSLAKGSGIQAGDKIHLRVVYAALASEKVLWYRKDIVTGKAVDLAARALSVSREDGRGMRFVRGHETDGGLDLQNDITLGAQIEDGDEVQLVKED